MLIKTLDLRVFQRGLEQGVQHMKAGFIGGKPGPLDFHTAETAHVDGTVFFAAPRAAPQFQLGHFCRTVFDKILHHILLT